MGIQWKSLASALTLGFGLLAFGPATSTAKADRFSGPAPVVVHHNVAPVRYRAHAYVRPYRFARPYRVVRVFAPLPFPHWAYRRVYYTAPYCGGYSPY